jgi:hypothetical protein
MPISCQTAIQVSLKSAIISILSLGLLSNSYAQDKFPQLATAPDYSQTENWLCRPGQADHCDVNLDSTRIDSDGTYTTEPYAGTMENPPVDCFYVYPTVSADPTGNSDLVANKEEAGVILNQAARFRSVCRVFAPIYRQVTLTALRSFVSGTPIPTDRNAGYADVKNAWDHYLQHDNNGRGVVLIGHSQGSGMLNQLIAQEIDGKPAQKLIVSAILTGSNTAVPTGKLMGKAFQHMPLCTRQAETGCIISYVTFRKDVPPPANSRFGRVRGAEMDMNQQSACTNPAELDGSNGQLKAYLASQDSGFSVETRRTEWVKGKPAPATPFVSVPGLLTAECVYQDGFSYLAVTTHGEPLDARTNTISGDVFAGEKRLDDWGLHLIDMNVAMGNLVNIVRQQGQAWIAP